MYGTELYHVDWAYFWIANNRDHRSMKTSSFQTAVWSLLRMSCFNSSREFKMDSSRKEQNTKEDQASGGSICKVDCLVDRKNSTHEKHSTHEIQSEYKIAKKKWNSTAYLKTLNQVKSPEKVMKRKLANADWNELKKQRRYANGAVPRRRRVKNPPISETGATAIRVALDEEKRVITRRRSLPKCIGETTAKSLPTTIKNERGIQEIVASEDRAPSVVEECIPSRCRKSLQHTVLEISDSPIKVDMRKKVLLSIAGPINSKKIIIATSAEPNAAEMTRIFQGPIAFDQECNDLLASIGNLSQIQIREGKVGFMLSITSNEKNASVNESLLTASMGCNDITTLLTRESFLSHAPIEYYRCLLMRDEMIRAKSVTTLWKPSFIASTLLMTILSDKIAECEYQFEKAYRHQDRVLIGKATRPTKIKG